MRTLVPATIAAAVLGTAPCQELLWEVHSTFGIQHQDCLQAFGDCNYDGADDLLVYGTDWLASPVGLVVFRVLSGTDGSVLHELRPGYFGTGRFAPAGDFDGDGFPDIMFLAGIGLEVWSIAGRKRLLQIPVVSGGYGGEPCSNLDCTGDGKVDVVHVDGAGTIVVTSNTGATAYTIPALAFGLDVFDVEGVGDLDNDGADDFLAGGIESWTGQFTGAVVLLSGRTGTLLRIHYGPPFTGLNRQLRKAGDVDGDGVMDYAAGNSNAPSGLIMIWSGATGALLRQWLVPVGQLYGNFLAGRDVDLDGSPDIIDFAAAYPNTPSTPAYAGRVRSLSTRDGQDLVQVVAQGPTAGSPGFAGSYADLGVQPGNPYPVFACFDVPFVYPFWSRIRAYRCSPLGTRFVGNACSNGTMSPTVGIRRVDGTPNDHSRIVLGSAPPNALAVCAVAPATMTTAGGITTPYALNALGLTGCQLLVPPAIEQWRITGNAGMDRGYAAFDFPQTMTATGGTLFAAQWLVLDPSTLVYGTTARYEFRLQ